MTSEPDLKTKAKLGIPGLDDILVGGLSRGHLYLVEGTPGTGKTTLALQYLIEGAARGETGLYITLSETERELRLSATSHGWDIEDQFKVFELAPPETLLDEDYEQSLLYSSDIELGETTQRMFEVVEAIKPDRIVVDSLSEIRLLAQSSLRYRRQILALKHYFARSNGTVLMLDDLTTDTLDKTVHSVAHGVIRLEGMAPNYGAERRRLRVLKYRGQAFRGGYHDFTIVPGGLQVFPRLVSAEHRKGFARETLSSHLPALDALLGGGIEKGSSAVVLGPSGAGKSLICMQFAHAAVERGEKVALFVFDEELGLLFDRVRGMGIDLEALRESGKLFVDQVDAAELSPGEFAHRVRERVIKDQVETVIIDSLNGYQLAMPEEHALLLHIHELLQYLNRQGVATFLTVAQHGLVGDMKSPVDITYLSDTVLLLRYFEAAGRVRRAISVIKKRAGDHEDTIREYRVTLDGLEIGEPLTGFRGVLSGVPDFAGSEGPLLGDGPA